jgi:pimeloyl-ACP methyl ester carboxylesterase
LLEHLGVEQVHVVGHSYGARIGLYYALLHPDRVTTLTLADPKYPCLQSEVRLREWPYWETWKKQLQQQGQPIPSDEEFINFHLLKQLNQSSPELAPDGLKRRVSRPTLRERDMGSKGGAKWEKLMTCTSAKQEFEEAEPITEEDFRKIAIPTLAMYGEYSHCLPSGWKLKDLIQDCQVTIIPNAGHFHPVSKPKRFLLSLQQFLKSHLLTPSLPKSLSVESFTQSKLSTALIQEQPANA